FAAELGVALVALVLEVGPGELPHLGPQGPLLRALEGLEPGVRLVRGRIDLLDAHTRDPTLIERSLIIRLTAHSDRPARTVDWPATGRHPMAQPATAKRGPRPLSSVGDPHPVERRRPHSALAATRVAARPRL